MPTKKTTTKKTTTRKTAPKVTHRPPDAPDDRQDTIPTPQPAGVQPGTVLPGTEPPKKP